MKNGFLFASALAGLMATNSLWAIPFHGGVSGAVNDEATGNPIKEAKICVLDNPYASMPIAHIFSDSTGSYIVDFTIPAESSIVYVVCRKMGYVPEYWDNATLPQDADPVVVIDGQITESINFALALGDTNTGISGRVTKQGDTVGIGNAKVVAFAYPDTLIPLAYIVTMPCGRYRLPLPAGNYFVRAGKEGYKREWYNEGTLTYVTVTTGNVEPNINFTLEALNQGAISGLVLKESNNYPINDAVVKLYIDPFQTPIDTRTTSCQGFYKFESVPPGTYFVKAGAYGFQHQWWDNKVLAQNADSIVVTDYEVDHINFYLTAENDTGPKGAVRGVVKDASSNAPIQGAHVKILNTHLGAYTNCQGKYLIPKVPAGTHEAKARAQGYYPQTKTFGVTANDTVFVSFELDPDNTQQPGSISGRVTVQSDTIPIGGAGVFVFSVNDTHPVAYTHTGPCGRYKVQNLQPGDYHVMSRASGYEKEWYSEQPTRATAIPVSVSPNQDTPDINFTLSLLQTGGISGTVIDTSGAGIPFAWVKAQGINNWFHNETHADMTGAYLIKDLIPGLYGVHAIAHGYYPGFYPEPVEVIADSVIPGINVKLTPMASNDCWIKGVVTDTSGAPITNALVITFAEFCPQLVGFGLTDSIGAYTATFPCHNYGGERVLALAKGYIPEFYDNKHSWHGADVVPQNSDTINFELKKFGGTKDGDSGPMAISGRIVQAKAGVPNAIIYAMDGEQYVGAARSLDDGSYLLSDLPPGTYNLIVTAVGYNDVTYGPISVVEENVTAVDIELQTYGTEEPVSPEKKVLWLSVAPTIVNHNATISYNIPTDTQVELSVYDVTGRKAATLVNNKVKAGTHYAILNSCAFTQGIYFVKLIAGEEQIAKKLILIR